MTGPATTTATEAKLRFGDVLGQVIYTGRPTLITKHGKNVAILVSTEEWENLHHQEVKQPAKKHEWIIGVEKIQQSIARYQKRRGIKDSTNAVQLVRELRDSYG